MTDSSLDKFVARGTAAARAAFTPSPPLSSSGYFWFETDTNDTYAWNGSAWVKVNSASSPAFRGCLVRKAADLTGQNYTSPVAVTWDTEEYDTDSIHSTVSNTSRLTVPSGVTKVRLQAQLEFNNVAASNAVFVLIRKNGVGGYPGSGAQTSTIAAAFPVANASTPVIAVTAGDYFEAFALSATDASVDITASGSWFAMEIIG